MTREEFDKLMRGIKAAYTNSNFMSNPDSEGVWYRFLKNIDYSLAEAAAYKHIADCKFPPTIAEILEQCSSIAIPDEINWLDGWRKVQKAIGRYGYDRSTEAIAAIKESDVTAGEVAERLGWMNLCMSENSAVDRANFRQGYEAILNRKREKLKLSGGVYERLNALTQGIGNMKMIGEQR